MKNMKKFLVLTMCIGMIGSMTACGNDNGTTDGADQDRTTQESASEKEKAAEKEKATEKNGTGNDAVDGTDRNGDGVIDNAVRDVTDGIDDVTDDVTDVINDVTDDLTGNGAKTDRDTDPARSAEHAER